MKPKSITTTLALCGLGAIWRDAANLTQALNSSRWSQSQWIFVADAPVIDVKIKDGTRAADGANWFATQIVNDKDVVSAKWMT